MQLGFVKVLVTCLYLFISEQTYTCN